MDTWRLHKKQFATLSYNLFIIKNTINSIRFLLLRIKIEKLAIVRDKVWKKHPTNLSWIFVISYSINKEKV